MTSSHCFLSAARFSFFFFYRMVLGLRPRYLQPAASVRFRLDMCKLGGCFLHWTWNFCSATRSRVEVVLISAVQPSSWSKVSRCGVFRLSVLGIVFKVRGRDLLIGHFMLAGFLQGYFEREHQYRGGCLPRGQATKLGGMQATANIKIVAPQCVCVCVLLGWYLMCVCVFCSDGT